MTEVPLVAEEDVLTHQPVGSSNVADINWPQSLKAFLPIFATVPGIVILLNAVQPLNAESSNEVGLFKKLMETNPLQYRKQYLEGLHAFSGNVNSVKLLHPLNAPS